MHQRLDFRYLIDNFGPMSIFACGSRFLTFDSRFYGSVQLGASESHLCVPESPILGRLVLILGLEESNSGL